MAGKGLKIAKIGHKWEVNTINCGELHKNGGVWTELLLKIGKGSGDDLKIASYYLHNVLTT